jgi:hypothetical protein
VRLVLVDHRGAFAVMPHPRHEIFGPGIARCSEGVLGVPKIMNVQALGPDRLDRVARPTSS